MLRGAYYDQTARKPPAGDIRQAIHHLETVKPRLLHHQDNYFSLSKEFWNGAARLAALAPPPEDDDEPAYFYRTLLASLLKFSSHDRLTGFQCAMLNISADRTELALEALDGLFSGGMFRGCPFYEQPPK